MIRRKRKYGLPPGSIVYTGNRNAEKIQIHYFQYDETILIEKTLDNHSDFDLNQTPQGKVQWYDIRGIHDIQLIQQIGSIYKIHSLILEDISDIHQRPKFEEYENGVFIIVRALEFDKAEWKMKTEQVAFYFRDGLVFTFQETSSDLFDAVRKRIQNGKGKIRFRAADYLVYALIDVLIDNYFLILEEIEMEIELLEEKVLETQDSDNKSNIHMLKKELLVMRKSLAPLREAIGRFVKSDSPFVATNTTLYLRDLYDHTIQVMDAVESFRDLLNGLQDLFISHVSFKMNQVIQVLTIVSTIFIPLTFLAGIYGMNFQHMPELHWKYGYFILLGVMVGIFIGLLFFFKRKKWI